MPLPHSEVLQHLQVISPAYPPSFDNSPMLFGWALFGRLLVLMLSVATIVRIYSLSRAQHLDVRDPVLQHRVAFGCVLGSTTFSSASDVITFLTWNELPVNQMNIALLITRVLDGATCMPLTSAILVPVMMSFWGARQSVQHGSVHRMLIGDNRPIWQNLRQPMTLTIQCAIVAILVSITKWVVWHAHIAY